jgi:hypothetical protein
MFRTFKPFEASGAIEFKDPDNGHIYTNTTLAGLYRDIITYRLQNRLAPIEFLREVVDNYMCGLPCNVGKCKELTLGRSVVQYLHGGMSLLRNMMFPRFATQAEAESRAAQCVKCPHNTFPDKGPFMAWSDEVAIQQVGERKTSLHNELGNCGVCTCPLRSKVFVAPPLPAFPDNEVQEMRHVKCWQLKLSGQE